MSLKFVTLVILYAFSLGVNGADCPDGQYSDGSGLCKPCSLNCKTCVTSASNCKSCNFAYNLPSPTGEGECIPCGFGCSSCNNNGCTGCYSMFYFENNNCIACLPNCASCTSSFNCLRCSNGFFLGNDLNTGSNVCSVKDNDVSYTGILIYIIISGVLIFFLIETIRLNKDENKERYYLGYKRQRFSELVSGHNLSFQLNQGDRDSANPEEAEKDRANNQDGMEPDSQDGVADQPPGADARASIRQSTRLQRNMGVLNSLNNRFSM